MGWLAAKLVVALLCLSALGKADISEKEADRIANEILGESEKPIKAFEVLKIIDPLNISDDVPEVEIDSGEVSTRFSVTSITSTIAKVFRTVSKATRAKLLAFFKSIRKASKFVLNKVKATSQKVWEKLKSKIPGDLASKSKKAGKKLVKSALREVFEQASELTLEYIQAMVVEYVMNKTRDEMCECPVERDSLKCRCCIKLPGFEKGCMIIKARPKLKKFEIIYKYNGSEFMKTQIEEDKERGKCEQDVADLARRVCRGLPSYLHFLNLCFLPGSMFPTEDEGFIGCFQLTVDTLNLGIERCAVFTPPAKKKYKGTTELVSPEDLEEE